MKPVVVMRPARGSASTVRLAAAQGLEVRAFPLSTIDPVAWDPPAPETVDALLLGSANALRHAGPALALYRDKPAFVVGSTTAMAARRAGLRVQLAGEGGLQQVIDAVPHRDTRLLRLAAREHVTLDLPPGISMDTRIVYETQHLPAPPGLAELLRTPALVLLHSAGLATHFVAECDRLGIARQLISLAALGPRIVAAAGDGWAEVRSAAKPAEADLLALAREMCQ
ncbi:uroporphyrinogen-III synthase [Alteraurantiacibacter buctensis]|uniref:Uroporphyrinogen-III synthase n=1 Tax=Alteraurantiacibacter buctensis TaxID=1503981 RepID=A0A844YWM5_9SPHN|nr:uroporphyrinogen-III synthase [Alteraurantiacibacter buctensis]MXO71231.1 uroporphyrinogen-III synthase [Alteraurantiacibacter buctensis]